MTTIIALNGLTTVCVKKQPRPQGLLEGEKRAGTPEREKGQGGADFVEGHRQNLIMLKSIPWNLEGQLHSSCAKFLPSIFLAQHLRY